MGRHKHRNLMSSCLYLTIYGVFIGTMFMTVNCQGSKHPEQALLEKMFDGGRYDSRVRPLNGANTSDPVRVSVNFFLRRVNKVDDINNEFSIQLTFRQRWKDERLSYSTGGSSRVPHVSLLNPQNKIWRPDTFFSNEVEGNYHELMTRNEFVRIYPNGDLLHSALLSLKLYCPMNLQKFPFDTQTCYMRLASYGYTTNDVKYEWKKENPVELANNLKMPNFFMEEMSTSTCDSITSTGSYSCLRVDFTLKRASHYYFIHVFIPCVMMTMISMVPFWIAIQEITARIIVNILTLLVLTIQTAQVNKGFPPTNYTKSVDSYTGICLTFVFASLLETATVHYLTKRKKRNLSSSHNEVGSNDVAAVESGVTDQADEEQEIPLKDVEQTNDAEKETKSSKRVLNAPQIQRLRELGIKYLDVIENHHKNIDLVSRIAFPGLFLIFNILYWIAICF